MSLFKFELYKLFKTRIGLFILFCLLNLLVLLLFKEPSQIDIEIPNEYIEVMELKLSQFSLQEANDYINARYNMIYLKVFDNSQDSNYDESLEITNNIWLEYYLFKDYKDKINKLYNYNSYINEIKERAETLSNVSIFENPSTFSYRNIQKTALKYEELKGLQLTYDKSEGVKKATQSVFTDIFAILIIFFICTQLITSEKDKKFTSLQRTTRNGRLHLILAKLFTLSVANLTAFILLYGVNYIVGMFIGYGDLNRAIQSVDGFFTAPYKISVKDYLIYYGLIKVAVIFIISLFMLLSTIISRNAMTIYSVIIGVFSLSFLSYVLIPYSSILSPIKYINIIYWLQADKLLYEYVNINFFGYPINSFICFNIFFIIYLIISIIAIILIHCNHVGIAINFNIINTKAKGSLNIYYHESRKLLLNNNTILYIILIIFINSLWILNEKPNLTVEEVHYRNYMLKLQGEYTNEKYDYIQKEYTNVLSQNNPMSDQSMRISALEKVKENATYLREKYEQGNIYNFIYEKGYTRLTAGNNNNRDAILSLILTISLIIVLSGLISTERQSKMIKILNTSLKGKNELLRVKYIISLVISIIVFILIYLPEYYYIYKFYGFEMILSPIGSLNYMEGLGSVNIAVYLLLINLIRIFGISLLIFALISISGKTNIITLSVASFIFLLPILLILIGLPIDGILPIISLLMANVVMQGSIVYHIILSVITLLISIYVSGNWWRRN